MKIIAIISFVILIAIIGIYFVYNSDDPFKSDEAMNVFVLKCANNANCKEGVKKHYISCASSLSFEKPSKQSDMQEYYSLVKAEINGCLAERIGPDFPNN